MCAEVEPVVELPAQVKKMLRLIRKSKYSCRVFKNILYVLVQRKS